MGKLLRHKEIIEKQNTKNPIYSEIGVMNDLVGIKNCESLNIDRISTTLHPPDGKGSYSQVYLPPLHPALSLQPSAT